MLDAVETEQSLSSEAVPDTYLGTTPAPNHLHASGWVMLRPVLKRYEAMALLVLRAIFPVYVVVIVVFSLVSQGPGLPGGDKLAHFSAYGVMVLLAMPLVAALRWRLMMLGSIVMLGIVLEGLQLLILQREASLLDLVANCLGVIVGMLVWMLGLRFAVAMSRAESG